MTGYVDATDRNTQFENIAALREKYISNGKPVIAVDTKKKELIGLLYRRLFPHMTRALSGVILKSIEMVRELIEKTHPSTGLWVRAHVLDKVYPKGKKCSDKWKEQTSKRILRDSLLPDWNYCVHPA